MSIESEQASRLIEKTTELTEVFLQKEEAIERELQKFRDWKAGMSIAFSANHFVWNYVQETKLHTILKADNVEINEGGGYDKNTGIFTAPTDGIYHFSAKVFINTCCLKKADGKTTVNYAERKWHEDMFFNINRYDKDKKPNGTGVGADKIGEIWIGEVGAVGADNLRAKWNRNQASDSVNHYLKAGEKVCVEFVTWNTATTSDGVMASYTFSGHRIA